MRILIKFPTRNRKEKFFSTLEVYYNLLDNIDNVLFVISLDSDDTSMNNTEVLKKLDNYINLKYYLGESKSKIHAVNRDVEKHENWDIILLASDDMIPQKKGYDTIIIDKMKNFFPDTDGVLWFNDGFQKDNLNTLCILGKKYYQRFNYIYFPEYKSCFSDNEFMEVANKLEKQKYFEEIIIKHEHPDWGYGKRDAIHLNNTRDYQYDRNLFLERKLLNFNL